VMCWRSNRNSGSPSQKNGRRHISTSGLASSVPGPSFFALFWSILSYFVPNGLPVARDGWTTGRGGQVRSRETTSGSRRRRIVAYSATPITPNVVSPRSNPSSPLSLAYPILSHFLTGILGYYNPQENFRI